MRYLDSGKQGDFVDDDEYVDVNGCADVEVDGKSNFNPNVLNDCLHEKPPENCKELIDEIAQLQIVTVGMYNDAKKMFEELKILKELPDVVSIKEACSQLADVKESFDNAVSHLQNRMIENAQIKAEIEGIKTDIANIKKRNSVEYEGNDISFSVENPVNTDSVTESERIEASQETER